MKTGMKAFCLALTLIGASACSPAHAASSAAKSDATPQATTRPANSTAKTPALKASDAMAAEDDGVVSVNNGTAEELAHVMNGVGLKKAQSIVSYREEYGPFKTLEQLQEVPGIGGALVERNRAHIKL